jgi:prephenate dehydrogenase
MKINIAGGRGIMGKVHKPMFENAGHEVIISGRKTSPSLEKAAEISDLTIVSVPILVTEDVIKKVAPYSDALMDFTGLKVFSIDAMLKYSNKGCEVGGLHPLYGDIKSLEGRTVIYCPTEYSGKKCSLVLDAFKQAGVKIKNMDSGKHDFFVGGIAQNARVMIFEAFALLIKEYGLSAGELYEIAPGPTKILLDLIARQVNEKNDKLYQDMQKYNFSTHQIKKDLVEILRKEIKNIENTPLDIRELFGCLLLKQAQDRAKELIEK